MGSRSRSENHLVQHSVGNSESTRSSSTNHLLEGGEGGGSEGGGGFGWDLRGTGWRRQRNAQGPGRCVRGFKGPSRCTGLRPPPPPQARCWAPEGGSRRRAHQRMSRRRRGSACCRRQCWGGGIGRQEPALTPPTTSHRAGGPFLGLGHPFPTPPGTPAPTTHGDMGGEGRAAGGWVSHSPSHGRTASVALASCLLGGGGCGHPRWLHSQPQHHRPAPLLPWARPAAGVGGNDGGARAWWTFLAPSRPRSLQRRGRMGHRVTYLLPRIASSRGLRAGFELGRVQVPPQPSASRGSRVLPRAGSGAAECCRACCVAGTGAARGCGSGSGV